MKIRVNEFVRSHSPASHGGLYSIKNPNQEIVDFSSNVNPLGCYSGVKKFLRKQLDSISEYPDSESRKLRSNIKWYTGLNESQIIVGNGATEIIYNFCLAFLNKKTKVLIPIPTFSEYEKAAKLSGSKILFYKTMNLNNDLEEFIKKIPVNGIVFLCNPNNPTGVLIPKKNLLKIVRSAEKRSSLVFIDETFIELVPESNQSIIKSIKSFDNLFILRSFTKSFGLAGIRIGYALGSKQIINVLQKLKIPWNVSNIAQSAASAAICYHPFLERSHKLIKKENNFLTKSFSKLDKFSCFQSSTNFLLLKSKIKSKTLQKRLLRNNLLIRDCSTFRGLDENYVRIAIKTRKENQKLINALEEM
jgi:threonine-phosphate decarboxylase